MPAKKQTSKKNKRKITTKKVTKKATSIKSKPAVKKAVKSTRVASKPKAVTKKKVKTEKSKKTKAQPKKKTRYTKAELEYFKQILLKERDTILENARANMSSLVDSESGEYVGENLTYASHMAEQGTDEMEREKNYLFVQRDEKYLSYIQDALVRIENGTYGVCIDCIEEPKNLCPTCPLIPKERLEIVPITQHCLECKIRKG
jgi:DnaK suppressor protein